jgi:hypothetical protein
MTPARSHVIESPSQAWQLIEQDYTLRLSLVASEWAEQHLKAWNAVFSEGSRRGNGGYYGPALVEMEIADANKRAEWDYQTCCEIWDIQGRRKCRAFFRAVFDCCLQPMFSVQEGCFRSELERYQKRTNALHGLSVICGHLKQEMSRIGAEWNTKLKIAARDNEHHQQRTRVQGPEQGTTAEPVPVQISAAFSWKELETRFRDIQSKAPVRQKVSAWFTRTESHSGSVTEEWRVEGNPAFRVEFEQLATIAARKLDYTTSENATKYWLGRVREWMQWENLDKSGDLAWLPTGYEDFEGHRNTAQHLFTERIAELSGMFCMELLARGTPESVASTSSEQTAPSPSTAATNNAKSKNVGRKPMRNREFRDLAERLWRAEQASTGTVDLGGLKRIATQLDASPFSKPSDHLERKAAQALNGHNKKFANSGAKKIMSWAALVEKGDKDQVSAMRKVLSRCANDIRK